VPEVAAGVAVPAQGPEDQDGVVEAELLDAGGDLGHLGIAVGPSIPGIGGERLKGEVRDCD
jgi:hypothetical protein